MRFFTRAATLFAAVAVLGTIHPAASMAGKAPTAPQAEIKAYMKANPGGTQVSDNAIAYRRGDVVVVFPDRGQTQAPVGLGRNVRDKTAKAFNLTPSKATKDRRGCPYSTVTDADWYCFYTDNNWRGRRLQFRDACSGTARDWGFNNQTSSWVNTNGRKLIFAYDEKRDRNPLWTEPRGISESRAVDRRDNDKLSYWRVTGGGCR